MRPPMRTAPILRRQLSLQVAALSASVQADPISARFDSDFNLYPASLIVPKHAMDKQDIDHFSKIATYCVYA